MFQGYCKVTGDKTPEWTKFYVLLDSQEHTLCLWKDKKGMDSKKDPLKKYSLSQNFYDQDAIPRKSEKTIFSLRIPELVIFAPQPSEKKEPKEELISKWIKAIVDDGTCQQFDFSGQTPHSFLPKHFHVPTWCQLCSKFLWGFGNQGLCCSACGFVIHKECKISVQPICGHYQKSGILLNRSFDQSRIFGSSSTQLGNSVSAPILSQAPKLHNSSQTSFFESETGNIKTNDVEGCFLSDDLPIIDYESLTFGSVLGEGGFGKVYDGTCKPLGNRRVAVKVIDLNQRLDDEGRENKTLDRQQTLENYITSLKSELKTLRNCVHPHILQFFGVSFDKSGRCLIITEQLATDLYKLLIKGSPKITGILPKITFCKDAADAMTFMHERNPVYLHLDLKPSNMLIDRNGKVKLCDFGLASVYYKNKNSNQNPNVVPLGTTNYMPPEFLQGTVAPSKASDVYNFTISMYEIFYQKSCWSHLANQSPLGIIAAVNQGQRPPLGDIPLPNNEKVECSKDLQFLFNKGWDPDPQNRPAFSEISGLLENTLIGYGVRDEMGRKFWSKNFKGQITAPFDIFFQTFIKYPNTAIPKWLHDEKATKILQILLGQEVALEKFGYFLDWYGPLELINNQTIWDRVCSVICHPSFYAEISKDKASELLQNQPIGTYITRISFARPYGQFALTFKDKKGCLHKRFRYNRDNQTFTTSHTINAPNFQTFCQNQKWGVTPFTSASPFLFVQKDLDQPLDETNYLDDYSLYDN